MDRMKAFIDWWRNKVGGRVLTQEEYCRIFNKLKFEDYESK